MSIVPNRPHEEETRQLFTAGPSPTTPLGWKLWHLKQLLILPPRSFIGAGRIRNHVAGRTMPAAWGRDFPGKSILIVGTGPSLDKVDGSFFDRFDTTIYINFALLQVKFDRPEYYFTTDIMPTRDFCAIYGPNSLDRLGPDRCVFAPVYLDQWELLSQFGRGKFTWLGSDGASWDGHAFRSLPLPIMWRYYPRQPDWDQFTLPPAGLTLPILRHTSALTAVLFAAMQGSREIGLIGCDFSTGRAQSIEAAQTASSGNVFSGAASELRAMAEALRRQSVVVTNHSWLV